MKKTIYDFERKYEVQDELLNEGALEGLDERTLHETIKAMLINTIKDCIKYENYMDPDMDTIRNLLFKENKTEFDNTIYTCAVIIANISNIIEPFMPETAEKIRNYLKIKQKTWNYIDIQEGIELKNIEPLFERK